MRVVAILPTLWMRNDYLIMCITSLANNTHGHTSIILEYGNLGYVTTVNNVLTRIDADAILFPNDDQVFSADCISKAMASLQGEFDGDGMIGIRQEHGGTVFAINLVGKKFLDRFEGNAILCPDYTNYFADKELHAYAKSIDKFYFCKDAVAIHYMPEDSTRGAMRSTWDKDQATWNERQRQGLLWGKEFKLVYK